MDPADYQPPLTLWGHVWRTLLALAIAAAAWSGMAGWQWEHARWWFFLDLGLGLALIVLSFARRRFPVTVAAVTAVLSAASASAGGAATLTLASLSTRRRWREILPVAALSLAAATIVEYADPTSVDDWRVIVPLAVAFVGITVAFGLYIGSRRELLATLRERAERAETEQSLRVRQARIAERARIAREMHDVLAHRISLLTLHAGALAYREDLDSHEVRKAAGIIQDTSHQALVELREVLGVLREGPGDALPELPQPDADDLPELIAEARGAGLRIHYEDTHWPSAIPIATGRTLYRIAQEGITNARKHARDTLVTVVLTGSPREGLTLRLDNPLRVGTDPHRAPESGLGLVGIAERVELAGGRLTHSVTPERRFVLDAWLPWPS
ncbi:sensor histidine kinase [Tomitella cavernea]|uniref:histidine kinase n=1 Tax=Tomitella cavernea TaxID=1387982 RepID=A0ABP9CZ78_9ACTN|nr:histidine kinase [Tomitella cavernea]